MKRAMRPRVLCAFDAAEAAGAVVDRALPLCIPRDGELLLLGAIGRSSWEPAGPTSARRVAGRGALSAALALAAERAWRAGVSVRTSLCAVDDLELEAKVQAAALGAEWIVVAEAPRGLDRLLGRSPRVRALRTRTTRTASAA